MRRPRGKGFWLALLIAVVATAVTLAFWYRQPGEPLTEELLAAARARWQERGLCAYDLEVSVSGAQEGEHKIEVRDGRVTKMTTGGAAVREGAWEYWSVEGMFRFLQSELSNREGAGEAFGADTADVELRVVFDDSYGYPAHFLRHVMGRPKSVEWRVRSFHAKN
ncbi:MAG: DUF6174 domain-containing protein [Planctomycetota bacterium]